MRLIITIAVIVTVGFATDEEAADNVIIAENTFYEVPPARALSDETNLVESLLVSFQFSSDRPWGPPLSLFPKCASLRLRR